MQPKNQSFRRRKYDTTVKVDVLKIVANGLSVDYIAQTLGINKALIYNRDVGPLETTSEKGKKNTAFGARLLMI